MSEDAGRAPRKVRKAMVVLAALIVVIVLGAAAWLGAPQVGWSLSAAFRGAAPDAAWSHVAAGQPIVAACDVQRLLASPLAHALRPDLDAIAKRQGLDLALAERNVTLLVGASDGAFGYAVASGFKLSPLLLGRTVKGWTRIAIGSASQGDLAAATDGNTVLIPLEPGIVAWTPAGGDPQRVAASLASARQSPEPRLDLGDASVRVLVRMDAHLRDLAMRNLPRQADPLVQELVRVDARLVASDALAADVTLTHATASGAQITAKLLQQLDMASRLTRGAGALASFLGPDAALLQRIPPLEVSQSGTDVRVKLAFTEEELRGWLRQVAPAER